MKYMHVVIYDFFCSYINLQTGDYRTERFKGSEPAWVEQVKICGDDAGKQALQKVCIVLRIDVSFIVTRSFLHV